MGKEIYEKDYQESKKPSRGSNGVPLKDKSPPL